MLHQWQLFFKILLNWHSINLGYRPSVPFYIGELVNYQRKSGAARAMPKWQLCKHDFVSMTLYFYTYIFVIRRTWRDSCDFHSRLYWSCQCSKQSHYYLSLKCHPRFNEKSSVRVQVVLSCKHTSLRGLKVKVLILCCRQSQILFTFN